MRLGRILLYVLHFAIIAHFAIEIAYTGYIVFAVLKPEGIEGPLMNAAATIPADLMMRRRAYAIENWVATGGLAIYLALTEIGPRLKKERGA